MPQLHAPVKMVKCLRESCVCSDSYALLSYSLSTLMQSSLFIITSFMMKYAIPALV